MARSGSPRNGRHGRQGLRSFSVSGRVREPGVKLAPAGITLRELVDEYCGGLPEGHELYGYLPGGASGGILPASMADIPLDFDTLQPHGCFIGSAAVMVLTKSATHVDRAIDAARNLMRFFEDESCGQCTPCRAGTAKARELIEGDRWDTALARRAVAGDARRLDLRPRPGRAQPGGLRGPLLPARAGARAGAVMNKPVDLIEFSLNGKTVAAAPGETILQRRQAPRRAHPAPVREGRPGAGRQLPRLRGGGEGRTHAGALVLPHADAPA